MYIISIIFFAVVAVNADGDAGQYNVSEVQPKDVDEILSFLRRTFFVDEPLNKAVELCPIGTSCPDVEEYVGHDLLSGFSLKATDKNGKIIAVMISGMTPLKQPNDGNSVSSKARSSQNPKFQKILYILANRQKAKLWEKFPNKLDALEIQVVSTDPNWRRKGILTRLINETEQLARSHYISLLRMDSSSLYSAKAAEKNGFALVYRVLYTDIKLNGQPLIVPEKPHEEDRVYVKQLNITIPPCT